MPRERYRNISRKKGRQFYTTYRHDGVYQGETFDAPLISILAGGDLSLDVEQPLLDDGDERLGRDKGSVDVRLRDVRLLAEHVGGVVEAGLVEVAVHEEVHLVRRERHRGDSVAVFCAGTAVFH